ncbi:putative f-box domain-containing protein [Zalerion maritima]|uniref:F-box domain-containing protein n=1 Tax=Zalerion maritima TaxID=339359 RepID=A0AAD5RF44_9PEZI|nr:putative f-box domain-containing protein [Zalerion maritima]
MDDGSSLSHPPPLVQHPEAEGANAPSPPSPTNTAINCHAELPIRPGKDNDDTSAAANDSQPPTLLTLPRDVLLLILKEVTHTNDLTSLALTNSTLYSLAIPYIYGRFDIVWPEAQQQSDDNKQGVDALTFGLATLCHGSSFARRMRKATRPYDVNTKERDHLKLATNPNYAQYTRKFSLGNGPNEWVSDYVITKESGKMLGTLVAIAACKMVNLETFVWDMPTGVLSDIFMSLSSLADEPNNTCKLERVWIRWHDNNPSPAHTTGNAPLPIIIPHAAVVPQGSSLTPIGIALPSHVSHPPTPLPISYIDSPVEYPTFSVLPPLKSLTVLDIDELFYLDEMATLIKRSQERLRELRVGIAARSVAKDFVQPWDGPGLQQVDHNATWPGASTIGERRLGGVLGTILGYVYDIRRKGQNKVKGKAPVGAAQSNSQEHESPPDFQQPTSENPQDEGAQDQPAPTTPTEDETEPVVPNGINQASAQDDDTPSPAAPLETGSRSSFATTKEAVKSEMKPEREWLDGKLRLTTLELERVPLSIQVCSRAFDWTTLTNLTILDCNQHEALWKLLRRQFQPTPVMSMVGPSKSGQLQYHLRLRQIHTDITSGSLLAFLKDTLAPNSLEVLYLQDRKRSLPPGVEIDAIFKGPIRRHRESLRKLLLDSSERRGMQGSDSIRWRHWVLKTDIVNFITSGRMPQLKELSVSLEYKDWHTFLQRLPNIPQLHSLHIPHIADHLVTNIEPKELASQILDIMTLRPEIQLCYAGILSKCFEFLEVQRVDSSRSNTNGRAPSIGPSGDGINGAAHHHTDGDEDEDEDEDDGDGGDDGGGGDDDDDDDDDDAETDEEEGDDDEDDDGGDVETDEDDMDPITPADADGSGTSSLDSGWDSDTEEDIPPMGVRFRHREILFYEDKVGIFKARHGRL